MFTNRHQNYAAPGDVGSKYMCLISSYRFTEKSNSCVKLSAESVTCSKVRRGFLKNWRPHLTKLLKTISKRRWRLPKWRMNLVRFETNSVSLLLVRSEKLNSHGETKVLPNFSQNRKGIYNRRKITPFQSFSFSTKHFFVKNAKYHFNISNSQNP